MKALFACICAFSVGCAASNEESLPVAGPPATSNAGQALPEGAVSAAHIVPARVIPAQAVATAGNSAGESSPSASAPVSDDVARTLVEGLRKERAGDFVGAQKLYEQALSHDDGTHHSKSGLKLEDGSSEGATGAGESAYWNPELGAALGRALLAQNKSTEAAKLLSSALSVTTGKTEASHALPTDVAAPAPLLLMAAEVARAQKKTDAALGYTQRVLQRDPSNLDALTQLVLIALADGRRELAEYYAQAAQRQHPSAAEPALLLALVAWQRGETARAITQMQKAARAPLGDVVTAHRNLGMIALQKHDYAFAQSELAQVAGTAPSFEVAMAQCLAQVEPSRREKTRSHDDVRCSAEMARWSAQVESAHPELASALAKLRLALSANFESQGTAKDRTR